MVMRTEFPAFAAEFSPFHPDQVAVGSSQYFGIVGNGKQTVARVTPNGLVKTHSYVPFDPLCSCVLDFLTCLYQSFN